MNPLSGAVSTVLHLVGFALYVLALLVLEVPGVRWLWERSAPLRRSRLGSVVAMLLAAGVVSRGAGLLREMLVASSFGAGPALDAVLLGLAAPMSVTVAMGAALSRAAVPAAAGHDPALVRRLAWWGVGRLLLVLVPVSVAMVLAARAMAPWWGQGSDGARLDDIAWSGMLGGAALAGGAIAGWLLGLANARGRHAAGAWNPVFYNVVVIAAVVGLGGWIGAVSLAVGTLAAEWLQVAWYGSAAARGTSGVGRVDASELAAAQRAAWRALGPGLAIALLTNANVVVDRWFARELVEGSVAALGFAERLVNLPVGLMGMALTVPMVTRLGEYKRRGHRAGMHAALRLGLRSLAVTGAAAGMLLAAGAWPLVTILFERGAFDATDTALCVSALLGYAVGTPLLVMTLFLSGAAMIDERPWRLVLVLVGTVALNAQLNDALAPVLGVMGIALSTSIVALVRVVAMAWMLDPMAWRDAGVRRGIVRSILVAVGLAPALLIVPATAWGMWWCAGAVVTTLASAALIAAPVLMREASGWFALMLELDQPPPDIADEETPR